LDLVNSRKLEFGAVREAFCALQAQGIPVTQLRLKVLFLWLPPIVATRYWKRYLGSERGEYTMARHARVAVDEMKELANDWGDLQRSTSVKRPAFDRLRSSIDQYELRSLHNPAEGEA
jgi:hypothetical protein